MGGGRGGFRVFVEFDSVGDGSAYAVLLVSSANIVFGEISIVVMGVAVVVVVVVQSKSACAFVSGGNE